LIVDLARRFCYDGSDIVSASQSPALHMNTYTPRLASRRDAMGNLGNILGWLFTDPQTAGASSPSGLAQPFPFYALWLVILGLALLVPIYYEV
jgi:hypothetical protein